MSRRSFQPGLIRIVVHDCFRLYLSPIPAMKNETLKEIIRFCFSFAAP
jgi:hypothetical protein